MPRNSAKLTRSMLGPIFGFTAALSGHLLFQQAAWAHGARIDVSQRAIEIIATFETGEPMANAQVSIYAPGLLDTPWQVGQTDSEGRFLFSPDAASEAAPDAVVLDDSAEGAWEVTVRKAGHGQTTTFAIGDAAGGGQTVAMQGSVAQNSGAQKWLSMAAILWGFLGTALYFSRKGSKPQSVDFAMAASEQTDYRQENRETVAAGVVGDRQVTPSQVTPSQVTPEEYR